MKTLISIVGPTASGKTGIAVRLAQKLNSVVVSADSRQIFRKLNIGTAKTTEREMQGIKHYLLDEIDPDQEFNAGKFGVRVEDILKNLFQDYESVLLVGGSGLYLNAVWNGFDEIPEVPESIRSAVNKDLSEKGLAFLLSELQLNDPILFGKIDKKNPRRVTRGIEIFRSTGIPLSHFQTGSSKNQKYYSEIKVGLKPDKAQLTESINLRVDEMMKQGLLEEVKSLVAEFGSDLQCMETVGYAELIRHLKGELTLEEAVAEIKVNTKNYAKRQMTFFNRYPDIHWFHPDDFISIENYVKHASDI